MWPRRCTASPRPSALLCVRRCMRPPRKCSVCSTGSCSWAGTLAEMSMQSLRKFSPAQGRRRPELAPPKPARIQTASFQTIGTEAACCTSALSARVVHACAATSRRRGTPSPQTPALSQQQSGWLMSSARSLEATMPWMMRSRMSTRRCVSQAMRNTRRVPPRSPPWKVTRGRTRRCCLARGSPRRSVDSILPRCTCSRMRAGRCAGTSA
mmetsp:Transcript_2999/g.12127  ORF Transcript_2999/g.12127 Transcript_2999/m.12127 type:complete len:210 (-) Transcript_2999:1177-1806(-)